MTPVDRDNDGVGMDQPLIKRAKKDSLPSTVDTREGEAMTPHLELIGPTMNTDENGDSNLASLTTTSNLGQEESPIASRSINARTFDEDDFFKLNSLKNRHLGDDNDESVFARERHNRTGDKAFRDFPSAPSIASFKSHESHAAVESHLTPSTIAPEVDAPLVTPTLLTTPARLSLTPVTPEPGVGDVPFLQPSRRTPIRSSSPHSAAAAVIPTPPRDADAAIIVANIPGCDRVVPNLEPSLTLGSSNLNSPSSNSSLLTTPSSTSASTSPTSTSSSASPTSISATSTSCSANNNNATRTPPSTSTSSTPPAGTSASFAAVTSAVSSLYRLDDFRHEKIASGFFSEVFRVTHKFTNEVMVLKLNKDRRNRGNVLKEVQLLKRLDHPNILKFVGVCVDGGQLHALTEMVDGGNLEELIVNRVEFPVLSWALRLSLLGETAEGMKYLHSEDIVHRDLTANNIFLRRSSTENGRGGDAHRFSALIGDFGLAVTKDSVSTGASRKLPVVGTPFWMAPECLRGDAYDEMIDVFSFGIVICQSLARIDADPDVLPRTQAFGVDHSAFSAKCVGAPPRLLRLALGCCRLDPEKRPPFSRLVEILKDADVMLMEAPDEGSLDAEYALL